MHRSRSIKVLGETRFISPEKSRLLRLRILWGQRGVVFFGSMVVLTFFLNGAFYAYKNVPIFIIFFFSGFMACFSFAFIAYKNFNFKVAKLLLKQVNVLTILLLASLNLVIDIAKPTGLDFLYDLIYLGGICILCCIDAVEIKDRILVISMSCIFIFGTLFHIYERCFGDVNEGEILLTYGMHKLYKRPIKRGIYFQILCFAVEGMVVLFTDHHGLLMIWATGSLYRETGTTLHTKNHDSDYHALCNSSFFVDDPKRKNDQVEHKQGTTPVDTVSIEVAV